MKRLRFLVDDQLLIAPANLPDGNLSSTVAVGFLLSAEIDSARLTGVVVNFLDMYPEVSEVWLAAPQYIDLPSFLGGLLDLGLRVTALALNGLRAFSILADGSWGEVVDYPGFGRGIPFDDAMVDVILDQLGRAVFIGTSSLLTAHSGYHFGKPSGAHSKYFLRAASAVEKRMHAGLVAVAILRRIKIGVVRRVWTDTAGILPVAAALNELSAGFHVSDGTIIADSFGGYAGLDRDFDERFGPTDVLLISSSTSGRLSEVLRRVAPEAPEAITLFAVSAERLPWLGSALFDLSPSTDKTDGAFIHDFESAPAEKCELCLTDGETAVALEGDGFFPATGGVTARPINIDDAAQDLQSFAAAVAGQNVLRVRFVDGSKQPRDRLLSTRVGHLLTERDVSANENQLTMRVQELLNGVLPATPGRILIAHLNDQDSGALANFIASRLGAQICGVIRAEDEHFDSRVDASDSYETILVVAAVVQGGRNLLNMSRRLRSVPPATEVAYLTLVAHPVSSYAFEQSLKTLTVRGTHPVTGALVKNRVRFGWTVYRDVTDDSDDGWRDEDRLLAELTSREMIDPMVARERRRKLERHSTAESAPELFLTYDAGVAESAPFPGVQKYFVFWGVQLAEPPSAEEVFYTVQCVLHNNRRSGKSGKYALINDGGGRFVIEPHMFDRFNDPILQACILRSAGFGELDYSADESFSRIMRGVLEFMVENYGRPEAAAVTEFLLSLSLGLADGRTRHLRLAQAELRLICRHWEAEEVWERLAPVPGALVKYILAAVPR